MLQKHYQACHRHLNNTKLHSLNFAFYPVTRINTKSLKSLSPKTTSPREASLKSTVTTAQDFKSTVSAKSTSPKTQVDPKELFSRLINLSSTKSILQHIENFTNQLDSGKNLSVFEDLLKNSAYSKSFQHAISKGLPHPASPVGRKNLQECLESLNKMHEKSTQHKKLVRYLQSSIMDHIADQFLKALHISHESTKNRRSYEYLNELIKFDSNNSNDNSWTELRKEIAAKQPNFDFEGHKSILLMCESAAQALK